MQDAKSTYTRHIDNNHFSIASTDCYYILKDNDKQLTRAINMFHLHFTRSSHFKTYS